MKPTCLGLGYSVQGFILNSAQVAQLVEQWTENPCVGGSIPPLGTSSKLLPSAIDRYLLQTESRCSALVFSAQLCVIPADVTNGSKFDGDAFGGRGFDCALQHRFMLNFIFHSLSSDPEHRSPYFV